MMSREIDAFNAAAKTPAADINAREKQKSLYSFGGTSLYSAEYLERLQNQDTKKFLQEMTDKYNKSVGDDPWLDWIPEDDDLDSESMPEESSVKEEIRVRPTTPPLSELLPPKPDGKHYTRDELNKVDDVLQIVILEYFGMLPSKIKHNADFIDGMSKPDNYFDFLRDGIQAICATTIPRLQELRRKLSELKPTELSITGRSSIHGARLPDHLRADITEEMLRPHANRARRESASTNGGHKNLPKRLFRKDRKREKPPD